MTKPPPLPKLRADLKQTLAATPRDRVALRRGLTHAIRAIEQAALPDAKAQRREGPQE